MHTPVYKCQLYIYPVWESARTNAFMPHFLGFFGMYCMKLSLPLKAIMLSSIHTSFESVYCEKFAKRGSLKGRSLNSRSCPGSPLFLYWLLSFRWRKRRTRLKRYLFIICRAVYTSKGNKCILCMYVCMYVHCMYVCMYVCTLYVCMYIHCMYICACMYVGCINYNTQYYNIRARI